MQRRYAFGNLTGWLRDGLWILLLLPLFAVAQQVEKRGSDPLQGKQQVDTARISVLLDQFEDLRATNPDSAIKVSIRAIQLSDDAGYELGKAEGFKNIGTINYDRGSLQDALDYFTRALHVYEKEADTVGISNLQSNLGSVYAELGDNPKALDFFIKSLRNAQVVADTLRIGTAYMNLGTIYESDESTWPQAIENYQRAIEMFDKVDYKLGMAGTQLNFGDWYVRVEKPREGIPYLKDALDGFRSVRFESHLACWYRTAWRDRVGSEALADPYIDITLL
jgi:tetratricopeptide (TPR) repeat protein